MNIVYGSYITGKVRSSSASNRARSKKPTKKQIAQYNLRQNAQSFKDHPTISHNWFKEMFVKEHYNYTDIFFYPHNGRIFNIVNLKYKYIVIIDKSADKPRFKTFRSPTYTVIRVVYDNMESAANALQRIAQIKGPGFTPDKYLVGQTIPITTKSIK